MPDSEIKIFISYAHDDDAPPPDAPDADGFVTFLRRQLTWNFRDLGEPRPTIWRDVNRISKGDQFEGLIEQGIADGPDRLPRGEIIQRAH